MKPPRVRRHAFRRNLQFGMATLSEQIGTDQFERSAFQIEQVSVIHSDLAPRSTDIGLASIADIHLGHGSPARLDGVIGLINEPCVLTWSPSLVISFSYDVDRLSSQRLAASLSKLAQRPERCGPRESRHWVGESTGSRGTAAQRYRRLSTTCIRASRRCGATTSRRR